MPEQLTVQEFQAAYADLYKQIVDAAHEAGFSAGKTEGLVAGAEGERKRIAEVRSQLIPGHEALIEEMINDGKTTGPEAAVRVLAAEKEARVKNLENYNADGTIKVPAAAAKDLPENQDDAESAKTQTEAGDKLDAFAREIQKNDKLTYSDALAKAKAAHPKLAEIYSGK